MSDECKPPSSSAIHMNNWRKTISVLKRIRHNKPTWKSEQIVDICHNVRFAASSVHTICDKTYRVQGLSQELKCLSLKQDYHCPIGMNSTKNFGCESCVFVVLEINKYMLYTNVCIPYRNVCVCVRAHTHCMYSTYILYRSICPLVIVVIRYNGWGCQFLNPRKYTFKWEFCVRFARHV